MLAVFAEIERDISRELVKAGIPQAREKGNHHAALVAGRCISKPT